MASVKSNNNGNRNNGTTVSPIHVRDLDYEAFAKECGQIAFARAQEVGLSNEEAERFREIAGRQIVLDGRC